MTTIEKIQNLNVNRFIKTTEQAIAPIKKRQHKMAKKPCYNKLIRTNSLEQTR
jgi:hypothetical protein